MGNPLSSVPSYLNVRSLARELEISESQVYSLTKAGVLPKPIKLTSGCVRWCWASVQASLASLEEGALGEDSDPFLRGVRDATKTPEVSRGLA